MSLISWKSFDPKLMIKLLNFWPPYLGAGIKTKLIDREGMAFSVSMKLGLRNTNYVGVHFGGSLYSMCDPFFMLILMNKLGRDYIVWDKWARVDFLSPGKGTVKAEFYIPTSEVDRIREEVESNGKCEPTFEAYVFDENEGKVAKVTKGLWVVRKKS